MCYKKLEITIKWHGNIGGTLVILSFDYRLLPVSFQYVQIRKYVQSHFDGDFQCEENMSVLSGFAFFSKILDK